MNGPAILRRALTAFIASTVLGGLLASGLVLPAAAAETHSLTVSVTNVTGTPLTGIAIYAIPVADGAEIPGDRKADGSYLKAVAVSKKPGVYSFAALGDFDHTLYFATPTSTTFAQLLGGASDVDRAQVIPAGQSTISASLATNAVLTGTAKSSAGKALVKALVTAYYYDGSTWIGYSSVRTDAKGKYTLRDLDPGSYKLSFRPAANDASLLYSGGVSTFEAATAYSVGVGKTVTVNAAFPKTVGTVTGRALSIYEYDDSYPAYALYKATAIAYPVTSEPTNWWEPRVIDYDSGVNSLPADKKGYWSIKNLRPGRYVIKIVPYYYNEIARFVADGTALTISAGKTTATGATYASTVDEGGSLAVTVTTLGFTPVANARVTLQSDSEKDYYFQGTSNANGQIVFGKYGRNNTIQPGQFTLTASTDGSLEPRSIEVHIGEGASTARVNLDTPLVTPGFVAPPTIAQTDLAVGTEYSVAATPKRSTSAVSYQWLRDGHPIYGADELHYRSRPGDLGLQLSVRVTAREFGFPNLVASAVVPGVVVSNESVPTNVTAPRVTPTDGAFVGSRLHILPGKWSVAGLSYDYTWFRDGVEFANDGDSYIATFADLNSTFTATVVASKYGHPDATASTVSGVTVVAGSATTPTSAPTVAATTKGQPKGSMKYTVTPGKWTAPNATFAYTWLRGGELVGTGAAFVEKATIADRAKTLEVVVSVTGLGWEPGSAGAVARKASLALQLATAPTVTAALDPNPIMVGSTVAVGDSVVASTGTWTHGTDDLGTLGYTYQWIRKVGSAKAASISGATSATYIPKAADVGAVLTVKVTASSTRWADASSTVAAGKVVGAEGLAALAPTIHIGGVVAVGEYVSIDYFDNRWDAAGAKTTYQWYGCAAPACTSTSPTSNFVKIPKATSSGYLPTKSFANGRIFVLVTGTKSGYRAVTAMSNVVNIGRSDTITLLERPRITTASGAVRVYQTVGSTFGSFSSSELNLKQVWEVCFTECLEPGAVWSAAIGDGWQESFTPEPANWGSGESYLRVRTESVTANQPLPPAISDPVQFVKSELDFTYYFSVLTNTTSGVHSISAAPVMSNYAYTQRWFADGEQRATTPTYTRTAADAGKRIYAVIAITSPWVNSPEYIHVGQASRPTFTPDTVTIQGTAFGDTFTLSDPEPFKTLPQFEYARWEYEYMWDGDVDYNDVTYSPPASRIGQKVRVTIIASSPVYGQYVTTVTATNPLAPGVPLAKSSEAALAWTGDLLPGNTVSALVPSYNVEGVHIAFEWQTSVDGSTWVSVPGATASTFTPGLIHADRMLRAVVTGTKPGNGTVVSTTDAVHILEGDVIRLLGVPVLTGAARVGSTLTTTAGSWSAGATTSIQWLLNGRAIPGAMGLTYAPLATHAGDEISVRVTGSQPGKLDVVAETAALVIQRAAAPVATKAPAITGTTTLTATTGTWNTSGLTFTFEWSRAGEVVGTGSSIAVAAGTTKADYRLTVRTTRFGYEPGSWTQP